jgi:acyl-CoA thioester hydrolase
MRPHSYESRVYYGDTDAGGVMYHAAYLAFAERARTEALRALGLPHQAMLEAHGVMFVVRRARLEYLRPVRLDALVRVRTRPVAAAAVSVTLQQDFSVDEDGVAALEVVLVCVGASGLRPARIPPRWRAALAPEP